MESTLGSGEVVQWLVFVRCLVRVAGWGKELEERSCMEVEIRKDVLQERFCIKRMCSDVCSLGDSCSESNIDLEGKLDTNVALG